MSDNKRMLSDASHSARKLPTLSLADKYESIVSFYSDTEAMRELSNDSRLRVLWQVGSHNTDYSRLPTDVWYLILKRLDFPRVLLRTCKKFAYVIMRHKLINLKCRIAEWISPSPLFFTWQYVRSLRICMHENDCYQHTDEFATALNRHKNVMTIQLYIFCRKAVDMWPLHVSTSSTVNLSHRYSLHLKIIGALSDHRLPLFDIFRGKGVAPAVLSLKGSECVPASFVRYEDLNVLVMMGVCLSSMHAFCSSLNAFRDKSIGLLILPAHEEVRAENLYLREDLRILTRVCARLNVWHVCQDISEHADLFCMNKCKVHVTYSDATVGILLRLANAGVDMKVRVRHLAPASIAEKFSAFKNVSVKK